MLATLIAAAEAGHESPKTLFYVCGGLLALWAVLVSVVGIRAHETFPRSAGTARAIMAVSALLVVVAMASAIITS